MANKIWLITGVSRGLGRCLAKAALGRGDAVIGTTRSGESDLPASDRLTVLKLDVTERSNVLYAVAKAHAIHGRRCSLPTASAAWQRWPA